MTKIDYEQYFRQFLDNVKITINPKERESIENSIRMLQDEGFELNEYARGVILKFGGIKVYGSVIGQEKNTREIDFDPLFVSGEYDRMEEYNLYADDILFPFGGAEFHYYFCGKKGKFYVATPTLIEFGNSIDEFIEMYCSAEAIHHQGKKLIDYRDCFLNISRYAEVKYVITEKEVECCEKKVPHILGVDIDTKASYVYEHYEKFILTWQDNDGKYIGTIRFVPSQDLLQEHKELVETMKGCYDTERDEYEIVEDISSWFPLFYFCNGDAFCLDLRNGHIVFYDHEVFDVGRNLHGLRIAKSINDLFDKWDQLHFADVYDWSEICNADGIDPASETAKKYI